MCFTYINIDNYKNMALGIKMNKYKCDVCKDTGYYGDNGAGIKGNSEYHRCDYCQCSKPIVMPKCENCRVLEGALEDIYILATRGLSEPIATKELTAICTKIESLSPAEGKEDNNNETRI